MYTQLCVLGMSILTLSTIFLLDFENVLLCFFVYVCYIKCIYVLSSVLWCPLRFPHKSDVWFVFTSSWLYVGRIMSYLHYLCLFAISGVQHICFFCFVCLRLVYPVFPAYLDCPFLIGPLVFCIVYFRQCGIFSSHFMKWNYYLTVSLVKYKRNEN
jgi:hypothetical protein